MWYPQAGVSRIKRKWNGKKTALEEKKMAKLAVVQVIIRVESGIV